MQARFNSILDGLIERHSLAGKAFAVGVSGGADSLALAILLARWAKARKVRIVALTVDHGLRKESAAEALFVGRAMARQGIEHHILKWEGKKPSTGIEEAAREARYRLMEGWCTAHGVGSLFIAHHKLDQAETFLMRLQRGSGVYGLAAMAAVSERPGGRVKIVRPLLDFMPGELRKFLKAEKVEWIEDPHNVCDDFLRVRVRKLLPELEERIGLGAERLAETARRMARARDYLEGQVAEFFAAGVEGFGGGAAFRFGMKDFGALHEEIGLRVLASLLQLAGGKAYAPRLESLERLRASLLSGGFKSATLGGCEVIRQGSRIWVAREVRGKKVLPRKEWADFVASRPEYAGIRFPHKAKVALA